MAGNIVSHYGVLEKPGGGCVDAIDKAEVTSLKHFHRQACPAARLNRSNICTIFDMGRPEGRIREKEDIRI